jgi:hypothetical protein
MRRQANISNNELGAMSDELERRATNWSDERRATSDERE